METLPTFLKLTADNYLQRFNSGLRGGGRSLEVEIDVQEDGGNICLGFKTHDERAVLVIPKQRRNEFGNLVLGDRNDRAVCPFMVVTEGQPQHVGYENLIQVLLSSNIEELFPEQGKRNFLDKILYGFLKGRGRLVVSLCQRFLNLNLFNALPLSGTPMQDWAMNHRLMIFDPVFGQLRPAETLEYQRRKNELLHPWGSIGLSDGAAAIKNYILQEDLKSYTAFGGRHHNPMRNLYSTLGMKGPEQPLVISRSAERLEGLGIQRGGWNWMTIFLDLPETFEDQILVDIRHAGKTISYNRSVLIYGEELVSVGDNILKGRVLGINEDGSPVIFDVDCDHAKVIECKDGVVPFDGREEPVRYVVLEAFYTFKDGFKITNQHGNKGIVKMAELGYVEVAGMPVPIDVIVSATSVQKRKNFGQILEALLTLTEGKKRIIVPDNCRVTVEQVQSALKKAGLSEDGTLEAKTPWGTFSTLGGFVHWGVIKTPEEQLWEGKDVWVENQRGLRTKGNKISVIELKALTTSLGPGSKVVEEILSHQQGVEEVRELLRVLDGIRGNYRESLPTVEPDAFVYLGAGMGTFHDELGLAGTVADEAMYPLGCYLQLPFKLNVKVPLERWKGSIVEGISSANAYADEGFRTMEFDRILIPSTELRKPWRHPTGMMGLSDISTQLNQILEAIDRMKFGEIKPEQVSAVIFRYLHSVGRSLAFKTGKVSQYLTSVRYPWSSKATAALSTSLEPNWVEIHKDMARDLKVHTGDYILVERFPCLGFMSTRIQRVVVTDDPQCKYVIRVSGNSLVSMNLDFDGDVIYLMSFHTDGARGELAKNFHHPHPAVKRELDRLNRKKVPTTKTMTLPEIGLRAFEPMTPKEHADINATSLSVKLWTGPTIALCYSLMRIVEGNIPYSEREAHIAVEVFLDMVGNSVFSQKHGVKSLREECIEAVCLADAESLIRLGFPVKETHRLCQIIREHAEQLGVRGDKGLQEHYQKHLSEGKSSIISTIVRRFHPAYFATRSQLHPVDFLEHLENVPRDLVGHLIQRSLGDNSNCDLLSV